jgi:hypothetical protein
MRKKWKHQPALEAVRVRMTTEERTPSEPSVKSKDKALQTGLASRPNDAMAAATKGIFDARDKQ